jgi:hypothetical protein
METNEYYKQLKEMVISSPFFINKITNPIILEFIENMFTYSVGIEFECSKSVDYNIEIFKSIPDIIDVNVDNSEQRYRIPSGIKGIFCLENLSKKLKTYSLLNEASGIHYHIDMTDSFHYLNNKLVSKNSEWILKELDKWNYKGTYNSRKCLINTRCWVNFQSGFRTAEIRIGEMTFDYSLLAKRIIHCNEIIKKLKKIMISSGYEVNLNLRETQEDELVTNEINQEITQEMIEEINFILRQRTIRRF